MRILNRIFAVLIILAIGSTAFAGIGIHLGMDMTTIEGLDVPIQFGSEALSTLKRTESGQPFAGGLDMSFTLLPVIDLLFSVDAAFATYNVQLIEPASILNPVETVHTDEEVPYVRVGAELTAMASVFSFPPLVSSFDVIVGAGAGAYMFSPIASKELLEENVSSVTEPLEPEDLVDEIGIKIGIHLAAGIKFQPPAFPLAFRVIGKYHMIQDPDTDAPENFMNVRLMITLFG